VGGGLVGVETADALLKLGVQCTLVEQSQWLCSRDLDARSAGLLGEDLVERGVSLALSSTLTAIEGNDRVRWVELAVGRSLEGDLVVLCAGIVPNVELARDAGLEVARGVIVDAGMRTSDAAVFACGDVAEYGGSVAGRWPAAVAQAEVAAVNALGGRQIHAPAPIPTRPKIKGVDLTAIGCVVAEPGDEEIVYDEPARRLYAKAVLRDGALVGVIAYGRLEGIDEAVAAVRDGQGAHSLVDDLRRGGWSRPDAMAPMRAA